MQTSPLLFLFPPRFAYSLERSLDQSPYGERIHFRIQDDWRMIGQKEFSFTSMDLFL